MTIQIFMEVTVCIDSYEYIVITLSQVAHVDCSTDVPVDPNGLQLGEDCYRLRNPGYYFRLGPFVRNYCTQALEDVDFPASCH